MLLVQISGEADRALREFCPRKRIMRKGIARLKQQLASGIAHCLRGRLLVQLNRIAPSSAFDRPPPELSIVGVQNIFAGIGRRNCEYPCIAYAAQ